MDLLGHLLGGRAVNVVHLCRAATDARTLCDLTQTEIGSCVTVGSAQELGWSFGTQTVCRACRNAASAP